MAMQNGIITGQEAKKLYSYPTLSGSQFELLNGSGTFVAPTFTVSSLEGGIELKWGEHQLCSIPTAYFDTTYTYSTDVNGNLVYTSAGGKEAFTIPVAQGE